MDIARLFTPSAALHYSGSLSGGSNDSASAPARSLHIAFIVPEDRRTGTYFRFHNLAIALQTLGHKVTVYSQSSRLRIRGAIEVRDGVHYRLSPTVPGNRWILPPTNPLTFLRRVQSGVDAADVYHLFQPYPTAAWLWLGLRKRRLGTYFYDWDDFWLNEEFGLRDPKGLSARWTAWTVGRLERTLPARSNAVTAVSHPLANLALEWGADRSVVIRNGVWPRKPKSREESRMAIGLPRNGLYAGLMGWSGEVEWCLEALRTVCREHPTLRLAITGKDPRRILAGYPDVANKVHYLGSLPDEKFSYFNTALDLGLVPMRQSEFNRYRLPYKLTDHLAGGTPVLCSRIGESVALAGELPGIILCEPTIDGWLNGFRETIEKLSQSGTPPRVPTESIHRRFSWPAIAREVEAAYKEARGLNSRNAAACETPRNGQTL